MRSWDGACQRCFTKTAGHIMSMYNEDLICFDCKDKESQRPDYKLAEAKDLQAYASRLRSSGMSRQAATVEEVADKLIKE